MKEVSITQKRSSSSRFLPLLCSILALLLDIVVIAALMINATELKFLICPFLIAFLDLVYIFKVLFSNYRFSYAINGVVIHVILILLICVYAWVSTRLLDTRLVFVSFAEYAMPAVHLIHCGAVLLAAIRAGKIGKKIQKAFMIVMMVLFVLSVGIYGRFLMLEGFFGQGLYRGQLTVTYSYDEKNEHYVATGTLKGWGNHVVIPAEFNGLPVGGIDCSLFTDRYIDVVHLECGEDVVFQNVVQLNSLSPRLQLDAPINTMDSFRNSLYAAVGQSIGALELANRICPSDLGPDEVYITVRYTPDTLKLVGEDIQPTRVFRKGTTFDISEYADRFFYVAHSDVNSSNDLYQCYTKQGGYIFRELKDEQGNNIIGAVIEQSIEAVLGFEKIYRLNISEDNDERYTFDEACRFIDTDDGQYEYRLALKEQIPAILRNRPTRTGFDFEWQIGDDRHVWEENALEQELEAAVQTENDCMDFYPVWTLKVPVITSVTVDGVSENHSALYGSDVVLAAQATSPSPSVSLRYEWKHTGTAGFTGDTHTINNLHPADQGEYILTVTAYSDTETSLTSTTEKSITVGYEKRTLHFDWLLPENRVYSATDKSIQATYKQEDVINADAISFTLTASTAKDAGAYHVEIMLDGEFAEKYRIPDADKTVDFQITPYHVDVQWASETSFVYNGSEQYPQASVAALAGDSITIGFSGTGINVGNYTVEATSLNPNYRLDNRTQPYSITARPIMVEEWSNNRSLQYNGGKQNVTVTHVDNAVSDAELKQILDSLTYSIVGHEAVNVGFYSITAVLPTNSNYYISDGATTTFEITKKKLILTIEDKAVTYSGVATTDFAYHYSALAGNDRIEEILVQVIYKGTAVTAINASENTYELNADLIAGSKYGNYDIEVVGGSLKINPKPLTVQIKNVTKVYDGKVYPYSSFDFDYNGLASTDSIGEVLSLTYKGAALNAINANRYSIGADQLPGAKYSNYVVTVSNGTLTIEKAKMTVTASNGSKIYDGTQGYSFQFTVEGLVNGETVSQLGNPVYGGDATTHKNVGRYTLTVQLTQTSMMANYDIEYVHGIYEITRKNITITAVGGFSTYDGSYLNDSVFNVIENGLVPGDLLGRTVYGGTAYGARNVGSYVLTVSLPELEATGNYSITYVNGTYTIARKALTVTGVTSSRDYNGQTGNNFNYDVDGLVPGDLKSMLGTPEYGGNAVDAKNAGCYTLTVKLPENDATNNYEITYVAGEFEITRRKVAVNVRSDSKVYDGLPVGNSFEYSIIGLVEGEDISSFGTPYFSGNAIGAVNVGQYTIKLSLPGNSNYEIIACNNGTFNITRKALTVTAVAANREYDGITAGGIFSFIMEGLAARDTEADFGDPVYGGMAVSAVNAGSYTLTVRFGDTEISKNYDLTYVNGTHSIARKALTVTAMNGSKVYNGQMGTNFDFDVDGLVPGDLKSMLGTPVYGGTAVTAVNAGSYALTVRLTDTETGRNYDMTYIDGSYTITRKALTVTAANSSRDYNGQTGNNFNYDVDGLVPGDLKSMLGTPEYGGNAVDAKNAGCYTLTVKLPENDATNNYEITYVAGEFEITRRKVAVNVRSDSKVYDGLPVGNSFEYSIIGLVEGEDISSFGTPYFSGNAIGAVNVGQYTIKLSLPGNSNYEIIACNNGTFNITRKALTVTAVAANREYDGITAGGIFSFIMEGLAARDTEADFGDPVYGGMAVSAVNAGSYTLTVRFGDTEISRNYDITYVDGAFEIFQTSTVSMITNEHGRKETSWKSDVRPAEKK